MILLAAINWHSVFFLLFALLAVGFAVAVAATSNIVRMAFYLTLCLGATAGLFFLAGAEFVGSMQLLIYVGGTLVLLIFGVMLTAQARFISMKTSGGEWVLAAIVGVSLLALLLQADYSVASWNEPRTDFASLSLADSKTSTPIGLALTGVRVDQLEEPNEQLRRGMSGYLFPFVIISMHLLVVLIGAAYMARTKRVGRTLMESR
jgi:NADH-quinone oxidoreductase subunit J